MKTPAKTAGATAHARAALAVVVLTVMAALAAGCTGEAAVPSLPDVVNQALIDHGIRSEGSHFYRITQTDNATANGVETRTLAVAFQSTVNGEAVEVEEQVIQTLRDGEIVGMTVVSGSLTNSTGKHVFLKG